MLLMLMAQWDPHGRFCGWGEHVMEQSLTLAFNGTLIYHTCIAVL